MAPTCPFCGWCSADPIDLLEILAHRLMRFATASRGLSKMKWYSHPHYLNAKKRFISDFSAWQLTNLHHSLPKIVFICGGQDKTCCNRRIIEEYFQKHLPRFLTFRAEDAWEVISKKSITVNALALEEWLASFSDVVIILVESSGTVAELGAFSLSNSLRQKLLPILSNEYAKDESFINTGPVKWVDNDSKFKPCIYANFDSILTAIPEIEDRIRYTASEYTRNTKVHGRYRYTNKVLLFFLLNLLVSLGPISIEEIKDISKILIHYDDVNNIKFVLSVGVALKIYGVVDYDGEEYYYCNDFKKLFTADSTRRFLHLIQSRRSKSLSSLIYIKEYKQALSLVSNYVA